MNSSHDPRSSNDPAPPSAEARTAFDEIVSDIVTGPLSSVQDELQALADEFRTADEQPSENSRAPPDGPYRNASETLESARPQPCSD